MVTATSAWAAIRSARAMGVRAPAAGVDDGEIAAVPRRVVGDPVPGHPGTSWTTASRRPIIRLTSVDLPTLGRPTTARIGTTAGRRQRSMPSGSRIRWSCVLPCRGPGPRGCLSAPTTGIGPRERAAVRGPRVNEMVDVLVPRIGRGASYLSWVRGQACYPKYTGAACTKSNRRAGCQRRLRTAVSARRRAGLLTSATIWSTTSSRVYGVVSRWCAPSAIASGEVARPESIVSRRTRSASVAATSAPDCSAARRAARAPGSAVR